MRVTGSTTRRAMSALLFSVQGLLRLRRRFDHLDEAVRRDARQDSSGKAHPDFASRDFDAEAGHRWEPLVERRHVIPEARRSARNTTVSGTDGPTGVIVPLHDGTVECRRWTFASHFVEAPAFAMPFIAPLGDEPPRVIMGPSFTLIVNDAAIRE